MVLGVVLGHVLRLPAYQPIIKFYQLCNNLVHLSLNLDTFQISKIFS